METTSIGGYRVHLDIFDGPLDLLLYLVRRDEIDILNLPMSRITAQFVEFLAVLEFIDLDLAGDFVVMASTLLEIKSRMLLPRPEEIATQPEITEDPRSELIQQLLEYKRLKDAACALEEHAALWQERYPRLSDDRPGQSTDPTADRIKEVELWDLVSALSRILRRNVVQAEGSIRYDETPLQVYMDQIGERVRREGRTAFSSLFDRETLRSRIVGMFLALLELLRHHDFRAEQPVDCGEIWVFPPPAESSPDGAAVPPTSSAD